MSIDYLQAFPELVAIGRQQLQRYCDEWANRPIAREFGIAQVFVDDELLLSVHLDARQTGDIVIIHLDELLGYIVDNHFPDAEQRRELHGRIREVRLSGRFGNPRGQVIRGRRGTLYLTCKSCGAEMETEQQGIEGWTVECPPQHLTCPVCGIADTYYGCDLHLRLPLAKL
ncbi:MAG: hypothetical protein L0228_11300 [Planctomycetes bacterium]|nr:hypothetical protein [Planctomycetota bacterium]